MITYTLKEGILVNAEVSRSANKNDNITKLIENTNFNSKITNSEFYFEIVDGIDSLKYEDNDDFNVDYSIELTQEELKGRIMREKDENLREFCNLS